MFGPLIETVRHALHRSRIRVGILLGLLKLGGPATSAELARLGRTNQRGVRGALFGDGRRYKKADSLIALGLVVQIEIRGRPYYTLSPDGAAAGRAYQRELLIDLEKEPRVRA